MVRPVAEPVTQAEAEAEEEDQEQKERVGERLMAGRPVVLVASARSVAVVG